MRSVQIASGTRDWFDLKAPGGQEGQRGLGWILVKVQDLLNSG